MASKPFSLKNNPIFQKTEVPENRAPTASPETMDADQVLTPVDTVAENTIVDFTTPPPEILTDVVPAAVKPAEAKSAVSRKTVAKSPPQPDLFEDNASIQIVTNYHHMDNEVSDRLAPKQTPAEHMVYQRMYRLSYGFQRPNCTVSIRKLKDHLNLGSDKTIQQALNGLLTKGHIQAVGPTGHNPKGNVYRVRLPKDILGGESRTRAETVVENTIVNFTTATQSTPSDGAPQETPSCVLEGHFKSVRPAALTQLVATHGADQVQLAMDVLNFQWGRSPAPKTSPIAVLKSVLAEGIDVPDGFVSRAALKNRQEQDERRREEENEREQRRKDEEARLTSIRTTLTETERDDLRKKAEQRIAETLKLKPGDLGFTKMLVKAKEDELLSEQYPRP